MNLRRILILLTVFFVSGLSYSQIIFKELPKYQIRQNDSLFFDVTSARKIMPLNGRWEVYPSGDEENRTPVSVPSAFKGNSGDLVFEKNFTVPRGVVYGNQLKLIFFGLNYSADISLNNVIIYRHPGGQFPISIDLPRDIIKPDKNNIIRVKLHCELDAENTIPVKQRFLFPQNMGGIFRDVYIHILPNVSVSDYDFVSNYDARSGRARVKFNFKFLNKDVNSTADLSDDSYNVKVRFISAVGRNTLSESSFSVNIPRNKEKYLNQVIDVSSPKVWSPSSPEYYEVVVELYKKDMLIDRSIKSLSFYQLNVNDQGYTLNGSSFWINGVSYVPEFGPDGPAGSYESMERDIKIIKETGFNAVRFIKALPHPYYLTLCEKYGLLAFIEVPLYNIPGRIITDNNFSERFKNYFSSFIKQYRGFSIIAGIGLGNGFMQSDEHHIAFLKEYCSLIKKNSSALTFASFTNFDKELIDGLDLYGYDITYKLQPKDVAKINDIQAIIGKGRFFISSASYIVNAGNSNGYANPYTFEAQAKFFDDLLDVCDKNGIPGFFINSMFDYRGDIPSLVSGFEKENIYRIGIAGEDRNLDRLAYKVISSRLHNSEKVTIPIGAKKENAPMVFILFGILLAIMMGVLVNSGRKFREDSSRALLRPYNFYQDLRDQRIMSGLQSSFLAVVISAVSALLLSNILFYFKESVGFEKLLISFGSRSVLNFAGYLAWHPVASLLILTVCSFAALLVITGIAKIGSLFVRNRVFSSSIYFSTVWSFLPLVLLIPLGIVLSRLLDVDAATLYIFLGLLIFTLWICYRLIKGISVIFDVNVGSVYFYGILVAFVICGGFILYFQLNNSMLDYFFLTLKQNNILR